MKNVLVLGAGKIGAAIVEALVGSGEYTVLCGDINLDLLTDLHKLVNYSPKLGLIQIDVTNSAELKAVMADQTVVFSACTHRFNKTIAQAAFDTGLSYFDLTEDVDSTDFVMDLAHGAATGQVFAPQCGLAPGFIGMLGYHVASKLNKVKNLKLRVGALPLHTINEMKYSLTWSTDGLLNEYCNPCEAIRNGTKVQVQPLQDLETLVVEGAEYEAFNTSGGLGTLADTLCKNATNIDYKTIRYPGHCSLMRFLYHDLDLKGNVDTFIKLFEQHVPLTEQDVVIVHVVANGEDDNGKFIELTDTRRVYNQPMLFRHWGAIQSTTAMSACAMIDLFFEGNLPVDTGFVRQELVDYDKFINNQFGRVYDV